MIYKGYAARIEYSDEDRIFTGRIAGIRDGVGFRADTLEGLREGFHEALDQGRHKSLDRADRPALGRRRTKRWRTGNPGRPNLLQLTLAVQLRGALAHRADKPDHDLKLEMTPLVPPCQPHLRNRLAILKRELSS